MPLPRMARALAGLRRAALLSLLAIGAAVQAQTMDRSAGGMTMRPAGPGNMWSGVERDGSSAEVGERLFRAGRVPGDGTAQAQRAGNAVGPDQVACANCHGRSGQGLREGGQSVPSVQADALAQPRERAPERPAYTPGTLARAIRDGLAPDGRALNVLMPRYQLSDEVMAALVDYLGQLRAATALGVSADRVALATVVAGEVPAARREAMLTTLRAYAQDRSARPGPDGRRWDLQVWTLQGTPAERRAQLEAAYAAHPVAAMVAGLGDDSWLAIHQFCEQHRLPCLFPATDLPPLDTSAFYSVYLDKGRALSGQLLARHLKDHPGLLAAGPLVQVLPASWEGYVPANALRAYLGRAGARAVHDFTVPLDQPVDVAFWRALLRREHPAALVVWMRRFDPWPLADASAGGPPLTVFVLPESLDTDVPATWPPGLELRLLARQRPLAQPSPSAPWQDFLHGHPLPAAQQVAAADAWFAARVLDDALAEQPGGLLDVDRLMSRIEYAAGSVVAHPLRPDLALGMGQRFAGKAGWLLAPAPADAEHPLAALGGIITP